MPCSTHTCDCGSYESAGDVRWKKVRYGNRVTIAVAPTVVHRLRFTLIEPSSDTAKTVFECDALTGWDATHDFDPVRPENRGWTVLESSPNIEEVNARSAPVPVLTHYDVILHNTPPDAAEWIPGGPVKLEAWIYGESTWEATVRALHDVQVHADTEHDSYALCGRARPVDGEIIRWGREDH